MRASSAVSVIPKTISADGWLEPVRRLPSPNFNARPKHFDVNMLVVHNISLPPEHFGGQHIESFFLNQLDPSKHPYFETIAHLEVSAHCLIARSGLITQFVSFLDRAWHAGQSCFQGQDNCNDFSIGIELEGSDNTAYTSEQYATLAAIAKLIIKTYPSISPDRVVGHSDIAPDRKTDPGPAFDWGQFRESLGVNKCT